MRPFSRNKPMILGPGVPRGQPPPCLYQSTPVTKMFQARFSQQTGKNRPFQARTETDPPKQGSLTAKSCAARPRPSRKPGSPHDRHDVPVVRNMVQADPLARKPDTRPPDKSILRPLTKPWMNPPSNIQKRRPRRQNQRLLQVRITIRPLQVDTYEVKPLPQPLSQKVHMQPLLSRHRDKIIPQLPLHSLKILSVDKVHLVQHNHRRNIPPVPSQNINQLIVLDILPNDDAAVRHAVDLHYSLDGLFRKLRQPTRRRHGQPTLGGSRDHYIH